MKVAVVYWRDACASDPLVYYDEESVKHIGFMASMDCGMLVRSDKEGVVLAHHRSESGFRSVMFIPKGMIDKIEIVGRTKE